MGEGLDPVPFITAAYGVAIVLIGGFTAWTIKQRKQLRQMQVVVKHDRVKRK